MLIDCDSCFARDVHCHDCVMTVLLNAPPDHVELDSTEQIAFVSLAAAGLIPPLRLVDGGAAARQGPARQRARDTRGIA